MEENIRTQEEISLAEVFKILLRKIKLLILVLLIGVFVGVGVGVLSTFNVKYYGTVIEFYVNPKKDESQVSNESQYGVYGAYGRHVMDNMTKLLGSESFAEQLLLNDDGLPLFLSDENRTEIDAAIAAAGAPLEMKKSAVKAADAAREATAEAQVAYNEKVKEWEAELQTLVAGNATTTEIETAREECLGEAKRALETAQDNEELAEIAETKAIETANDAVEAARVLWRATELYETLIVTVTESVDYTYYDETETDVDDLARSFIYVNISVLNDEELANDLFDQILVMLPRYVETNMAVPSGYIGTNCQRITRLNEVELTNSDYMLSTSVKFGLIFGLASLVIACVVVIVVDRSNKRLRNYETTMEKFNVPVLGVIPTINENEKMTENKSETEVQK
ncbi:MAG: hypothetical protein IJ514_07080 [Clostridia bacterium]|nr:hypothetical protein [Clostridia bacterium]